ncbi:hypothetical protein M0R45_011373 [Rubus argutus]|uniref:Zinc finger RING-type eukaryotic domain-containing protein n=1 Tax=Rubus argutus TaxID=59490 RepID=A0AAW1YAK7_RUBAR
MEMEPPELPECPVCLQNYDGESTIPRVLACGHSACEVCLVKLPTATRRRFAARRVLNSSSTRQMAHRAAQEHRPSLTLSIPRHPKTLTLILAYPKSPVNNRPMKFIISCLGFGPTSFTPRGRTGFLRTTPFRWRWELVMKKELGFGLC